MWYTGGMQRELAHQRPGASLGLFLALSMAVVPQGACTARSGSSRQGLGTPTAGVSSAYGATARGGAWVEFTVPSSSTVVRFPTQPRVQQRMEQDRDGASLRFTSAFAPYSNFLEFGVVVTQAQGGMRGMPQENLQSLREVMAEDHQERSFDGINIGGMPGFDATFFDPQNGVVLHTRALAGRTRLYTLLATTPASMERQSFPVIAQFMEGARFDASESFSRSGDGQLDLNAMEWSIPAEAAFAIRFPGEPSVIRDESPVEGANFVRTYRVIGAGGATFEVRAIGYNDGVPEGTLAGLEAAAAPYQLREAHDTTRQGFSARSLVFEAPGRVRSTLVLLTRYATYEITVDLPRDADEAQRRARAVFLDSFRIL